MSADQPAAHPLPVRQVRIPHGGGDFNGWYSFARGAMISRRLALRVLIFGPRRSKIETMQSQDAKEWGF
jgi:hypothetical protein